MPFYGTPDTGSADDFVESARTGQLDAVQRALKAGVDVNAADRFGCVCACVWLRPTQEKTQGVPASLVWALLLKLARAGRVAVDPCGHSLTKALPASIMCWLWGGVGE